MLVLTRKLNEGILIGEDIKIVLLGVDKDRIKLGIDAPGSMRIFRMEMLEKTIDENRTAVCTNVDLRALVELKKNSEKK